MDVTSSITKVINNVEVWFDQLSNLIHTKSHFINDKMILRVINYI